MQRFKNKIIVIVMAVIVFSTGIFGIGSMRSKISYALTPEFNEHKNCDTIYYFSDSTTEFRDMAEGMAGDDYRIIFDIKYLITEQELAYLLYSGYFWGFEQSNRSIAVIEIKTMRPDSLLLENLFACLKAQGCWVMFISPYAEGYNDLTGYDTVMPCNKDNYNLFIKQCISEMMGYNEKIRNDTTLFIDGRFLGIDYDLEDCDLAQLCSNSSTLRKMLCYMCYGCKADEANFEKQLYEQIWQVYQEYFVKDLGSELNYFKGDTNIDDYIAMWEKLQSYYFDFDEYFIQEHIEEYLTSYKEQVGFYFDEITKPLTDNNIHILAHVDGDRYIDLLKVYDYAGEYLPAGKEYYFSDYEQFKSGFDQSYLTENLCAMGIWNLKSDYYDFLYNTQYEIYYSVCIGHILPVYIWEEQPIIWADDLIIQSDTMMREDAGEADEYDEEELKAMFEEAFLEILGK